MTFILMQPDEALVGRELSHADAVADGSLDTLRANHKGSYGKGRFDANLVFLRSVSTCLRDIMLETGGTGAQLAGVSRLAVILGGLRADLASPPPKGEEKEVALSSVELFGRINRPNTPAADTMTKLRGARKMAGISAPRTKRNDESDSEDGSGSP